MKKILILGSTGMLGNAVTKRFLKFEDMEIYLTYRSENVKFSECKNNIKFDVMQEDFSALPKDFDYVINCIGIIKPFMGENPIAARYINAVFPWKLAKWCKKNNSKLIHITTDCVFSGLKGKYVESDLHDALDDYGKSKSLGEPVDECMVLRTSIIGEEIHKNVSLIAWVKSQKDKTVNGFTNHLWNGVTTDEYAKCCEKIIKENLYEVGLFHIYAKDIVTKYEMMQYFNKKFGLNLTINSMETNVACDRSMASEKDLCKKLDILTVKELVMEM
jgi:dTDP-4-dehydrorhamnose reductase